MRPRYVPSSGFLVAIIFVLSHVPSAHDCLCVEPVPADGPSFPWLLGNCNRDRRVDLADIIEGLSFMFDAKARTPCIPLCDIDRDGALTVSDVIGLLDHLFQGERLPGFLPEPVEVCDSIDNNCDGSIDEDCPTGEQRSVTISWNPVTRDVIGNSESISEYLVYFGQKPHDYQVIRAARNATTHTVSGLRVGVRYYFAVTALDTAGNASGFSEEADILVVE